MRLSDFYRFLSKFSFSHSSTPSYFADSEDLFAVSVADTSYSPTDTSGDIIPANKNKKEFKAVSDAKSYASSGYGAQYEGLISEDIVIDGSVTSGSNLKIAGVIKGDVVCRGDVEIRGRVHGDVTGARVTLFAAEVTGNIKAQESLKLEGGSITGSVESTTAEIDGTVSGNLTMSGLLNIKAAAVIKGDITAASVAMAANASVIGKFSVGSDS